MSTKYYKYLQLATIYSDLVDLVIVLPKNAQNCPKFAKIALCMGYLLVNSGLPYAGVNHSLGPALRKEGLAPLN